MSTKLPEVEDLTIDKERLLTVDVEFSAEQRAALQTEADRRGVTLEEYVRWAAHTAAGVSDAGGASNAGGKA
jgi:hypothetical protein